MQTRQSLPCFFSSSLMSGADSRFMLAAALVLGLAAPLLLPQTASADEVRMRNGDVYYGQVLTVDTNILVLASRTLGKVSLRRADANSIQFGVLGPPNIAGKSVLNTNVATKSLANLATVDPNQSSDITAALARLNAGTNTAAKAPSELLAAAGPEATRKFNELVTSLMTGRLSIADLRQQAKSVSDQVRNLKADLGPEASATIDGYLSILDSFVNEASTAKTK